MKPTASTPSASTAEFEAGRLRALQEYGVLDTAPETAFDALTRLAAQVLGVPIALISLVDAQRQWFKSRVGLEVEQTPRDISFCEHAIRGNTPLVVRDAQLDPRFASSPLVTGEPHVRFYAGVPLCNAQGWALGTLCVIDHQPRDLSAQELRTLGDLAQQVLAQLELRRQNLSLREVLGRIEADRLALAEVQQALRGSESRLREVLHETNDGWWEFDLRERSLYLSPRAECMLGHAPAGLPGGSSLLRQLLPADELPRISALLDAVLAGREPSVQVCVELLDRHGSRLPMLARGHVQRNAAGEALRLTGTLTDLRPVRQAERERGALERRYQTLYQHSLDGVMLTEPGHFILSANPAACTLLGYAECEMQRLSSHQLIDPSDPRGLQLLNQREREGQARGELRLLRSDGRAVEVEMAAAVFRDDQGRQLCSMVMRDVSARKAAERQMFQLAHFDPLTGLSNRHRLMERLGDCASAARRHGHGGALLFIDLDNFKEINDAKGHATGDQVLCSAAQRLQACVRREDLVARLGGDEFVVVLGELSADPAQAAAQAQAVAAKICERLSEPQHFEGLEWAGSASVGISLFPKPGHGGDDLLREADTAMYEAKQKGRNGWAIFERDMQTAVEERLQLQSELRRALELGQFELHVQQQLGPRSEVLGAELLLRWRHPVRGMIPPTQFISLAEDTGLIVPIGDWVLRQAAQTLRRLAARGHGGISLSVNVSPRQFHDAGFVERLGSLLKEAGADPRRLVLEITEGLLLRRSDEVLARMRELNSQGLRFSIDDFGTGYSSLAYLQSMPLYELKIDRGFVRDIPGDAGDTAIVQSILSMAQPLGLHVVAEGVETAEQTEFLLAHGCDALQGYWLHRPQALEDWLAALPVTPRMALVA